MATTIVSGANILRARTVLNQADIFALSTTPVLIAPAVPGKSLVGIQWASSYLYGTTTYTVAGSATFRYGPTIAIPPMFPVDQVRSAINGMTTNWFREGFQNSFAATPLANINSLGVYLVSSGGYSASGGDGSLEFDLLYQAM